MSHALDEVAPATVKRKRNANKTICRMERDDRYLAVRPYLHCFVIVRAAQYRAPADAVSYAGIVRAIGWGVEGSADVLVLTPTGRQSGLPTLSIELTRILTITQTVEGKFPC
jgi:hypothetical protein